MAFNENKPLVNSPLNSAEIRNNFQHLKEVVSKEHTWDDKDPANAQHKLDEIKGVFSKSKQGAINSGASASYGKKGTGTAYISLFNTTPAISEGQYSVQEVLEKLVESSHYHAAQGHSFALNCNCNCDCNCGGNN